MSEQDSKLKRPPPRSRSPRPPGPSRDQRVGATGNQSGRRDLRSVRPRSKPAGRILHLFLNPRAAGYKRRMVEALVRRLRRSETQVEVYDAVSGAGLLLEAKRVAEQTAVERKPQTILVAVGGDGTVNLVARAAMDAELPIGILPFGRENNIARALLGTVEVDAAAGKLAENTTSIDTLLVGDQLVISAAGLGLLPSLHSYLLKKGAPRFGIGWGSISSELYKKQSPLALTLKLDAHRLTVSTRILSIHLLPYAAGLNLSPMSQRADTHFEIILDRGTKPERAANYVRDAAAKQLRFGAGLIAYRCAKVTIQPVRQLSLYLDGELVVLPSDVLEISRATKQLSVVGVV